MWQEEMQPRLSNYLFFIEMFLMSLMGQRECGSPCLVQAKT